MRETLARAVEHCARPPNTGEYAWWREQQIALARAQGEANPQMPTDAPYRGRWKSGDAALLHFGYTPEQLALRDEQRAVVKGHEFEPFLPEECAVADLAETLPDGLPLEDEEAERIREIYEGFARCTRYMLTAGLGLGGIPKLTRGEAAKSLGIRASRVQQIQLYAIDELRKPSKAVRRFARVSATQSPRACH